MTESYPSGDEAPQPENLAAWLRAVRDERAALVRVTPGGARAAQRSLAGTHEQLLDRAEAAEAARDGEALGEVADEMAANEDTQGILDERAQGAAPAGPRVAYRSEGGSIQRGRLTTRGRTASRILRGHRLLPRRPSVLRLGRPTRRR